MMKVKDYLLYYCTYKVGVINLKRKLDALGSLSMKESKTLKD